MKRSKIIGALLSLVILAAAALVAETIDNRPALEEKSVKKESLSFQITWPAYSGRGEAIQRIVDLYNAENSAAFEITLVGGDEDRKASEKRLSAPDATTIHVLPYRFVKYFAAKGYLDDLSDYFKEEEQLFYPALWQLGQFEGRVYGIPWLGHSIGLLYNKELLAKARVDVASIRDLPSLVKALESVEAKTGAKGIGLVGANHNDVSWMVNQFVYAYGGRLVEPDGTRVALNSAETKAALRFYRDSLGPHAQPSWLDDSGLEVMEHFRKQKIAFEFQGVWGITDIEKNGNPFEVGSIKLEEIGLYAEVGPMMLALPRSMSREKKQSALRFMKFMISKEAQVKILAGEYSPEHDAYYPFRIPVRQDVADSVMTEKYPQYLPFVSAFKRPSIDVPVAKWQIIKDEYYAPGLHQVMTGEVSIEDFLKRIESKGNEILRQP